MRQLGSVEICDELWLASDPFLDLESVSESVNYVMAMLFWRYATDVWRDRTAYWKRRHEGNQAMVQRRLSRERILIPKGCTLDAFSIQRAAPDIGERINAVLDRIMAANRHKLGGVFDRIDFGSERYLGRREDRNVRLRRAIEGFCQGGFDFQISEFGDSRLIGEVVDLLLERFSFWNSRHKRAFHTPASVSRLLGRLLAPSRGESIYDPVCGSGSLLVVLGREVAGRDFALFGQEVNPMTHSLCRLNLLMQGGDAFRIEHGDSLVNPQFVSGTELMTFDVVVGDLPSLNSWDRERGARDPYQRFRAGLPPRSRPDFAFILHMIHCARKDGGRVGVVVSRGILFRGGVEGELRKHLIEENLVDAVVAVPPKLMDRSSATVVILILRRSRRSDEVTFVDASAEFAVKKNRNEIEAVQIDRIVAAYRHGVISEGVSVRVSVRTIAKNGYSLDLENYISAVEARKAIDLESVRDEIRGLEGELAEVRTRMKHCLEKLGI